VRDGVQALNIVSLVGGCLLVLAVVLLVFNLGRSLGKRGGLEPDADPWDGHTLEWAADPATVPVTSAAPLLDQKEAADT
jgi:heme/copper-type cytochrome/quinol oxidase subunit 1